MYAVKRAAPTLIARRRTMKSGHAMCGGTRGARRPGAGGGVWPLEETEECTAAQVETEKR